MLPEWERGGLPPRFYTGSRKVLGQRRGCIYFRCDILTALRLSECRETNSALRDRRGTAVQAALHGQAWGRPELKAEKHHSKPRLIGVGREEGMRVGARGLGNLKDPRLMWSHSYLGTGGKEEIWDMSIGKRAHHDKLAEPMICKQCYLVILAPH